MTLKTLLFHPPHSFFDTKMKLRWNILLLSSSKDEEMDADAPRNGFKRAIDKRDFSFMLLK